MNVQTWKTPTFFSLDEVESIAEEEASITLTYNPPIILPDNITLEECHDESTMTNGNGCWDTKSTAISSPPVKIISPSNMGFRLTPWLWLVASLGLLLLGVFVVDTYTFVVQQYQTSLFLGTLFSLIIASIISATLILSYRSYRNIQKLRTVMDLQQLGQHLIMENNYGKAIPYLNQLAEFYQHRPQIRTRIDQFYVTLVDTHSDREMCQLFSKQVMSDIDQQAYRIVTKNSKETALMLMLSPFALLDTLLTLWRNLKMIREIANLYGGKPGILGSISLSTVVIQNLIYAGASEIIEDGIAESLGKSVLSVFFAQAAQALGSGLMTARVGLKAMQVCRPLPFTESERPRLKEVRRDMVATIKQVYEVKNEDAKKENAS